MRSPSRYASYRAMVSSLAAAVFLAALPAVAADTAAYQTIPVGEKAPTFKTVTIEGQPFDLQEQLASKPVALFFWSLFCGPCREEMPLLEKLYQELKGKQVAIVGVNLDEPTLHNAVKNFLKSAGFSYPIIVNKTATIDAQIDKLYLVTGTPVVYLIKQDGSVAFGHVGRIELADLRKLVEEKLLAESR